jgi:hypothetical protein
MPKLAKVGLFQSQPRNAPDSIVRLFNESVGRVDRPLAQRDLAV